MEKTQMEKMNSFGTITDTILVVDKKNRYTINKRALHLVYAFLMLSFTIFSLLLVGNFFTNLNSYTHINTSETSAASLLEKQNANNNDVNTINGGTNNVKPHFVVIVADDLGWNSLGYAEDSMAFATPYLTSLAESGIIMENFYAQEVCSPSRGSLLTGRYPLSIGMQYGMVSANAEWGMPLDETTIAEVLQDSGYTTHMLGKWHLGYFSPKFLPTSRGFDSWTGYANGENYYWSKKNPDYTSNVDFITSNKSCYKAYDGEDIHNYSTTFYTTKAVNIIQTHDTSTSLFLYIAYQAVHDPFVDYGKHSQGMPDSYIDDDILSEIHQNIVGTTRQEYVKSLYILDKGVGEIVDALEAADIMDNTYIIFMSDNGGCWYGGGRNGPLRGAKGALFEGGIKVDSFIYSPLLSSSGTTFSGLMHISDWFPTILALAQITYRPSSGYELDGVSQINGWNGNSVPRSTMLYNMYVNVSDFYFNIWSNGSFAVRDARFKLMHTYDDKDYGDWYSPNEELEDDDDLDTDNRCAQQFLKGKFTYWLFDLVNDPYEKVNLYSSTNQLYVFAKEKLYTLLPDYEANSKMKKTIVFSSKAEAYWTANDHHMLPWANEYELNGHDDGFPLLC
jgi:arylsulfatase A-like enzyme